MTHSNDQTLPRQINHYYYYYYYYYIIIIIIIMPRGKSTLERAVAAFWDLKKLSWNIPWPQASVRLAELCFALE